MPGAEASGRPGGAPAGTQLSAGEGGGAPRATPDFHLYAVTFVSGEK